MMWTTQGCFVRNKEGQQFKIRVLPCSGEGCLAVRYPTGLDLGFICPSSPKLFINLGLLRTTVSSLAKEGRTMAAVWDNHVDGYRALLGETNAALCCLSRDQVKRTIKGGNALMERLPLTTPGGDPHYPCAICKDTPYSLTLDGCRVGPANCHVKDLKGAALPKKSVGTKGLLSSLRQYVLVSDSGRALAATLHAICKQGAKAQTQELRRLALQELEPVSKRLTELPPCRDVDILMGLTGGFRGDDCPPDQWGHFVPLLEAISKRSAPSCVFNRPRESWVLLERLLNTTIPPVDAAVSENGHQHQQQRQQIDAALSLSIGNLMPCLGAALTGREVLPSFMRPLVRRLFALSVEQTGRAFGTPAEAEASVWYAAAEVRKPEVVRTLDWMPEGVHFNHTTSQDDDILRGMVVYPCLGGKPLSHSLEHVEKIPAAGGAGGAAETDGADAICKHGMNGVPDFSSFMGSLSCAHGHVYAGFCSPEYESMNAFYQLLAGPLLPLVRRNAALNRSLIIVYDSACQLWTYINKRHAGLAAHLR